MIENVLYNNSISYCRGNVNFILMGFSKVFVVKIVYAKMKFVQIAPGKIGKETAPRGCDPLGLFLSHGAFAFGERPLREAKKSE